MSEKDIKNKEHSHEHHQDCNCGHEHEHEQEHSHDCDCGHDHEHQHHQEHSHDCGCGHDHEHQQHQEHSHDCDCGHDHEHPHHQEHSHDCGCGHDHEHQHEHDVDVKALAKGKSIYILENLGCANCAAKMEKQIQELPGVEYASITYATKQLRVTAKNPDELLPAFQRICSSIESEVKVIPQVQTPVKSKKTADKKKGLSQNGKTGLLIGCGAVLFITGKFLEHSQPMASTIILLISYVLLGGRIVWKALKNLTRGQIFDENFLMSLATIAAIVIGDYAEAVGVMLFYRTGELFEDVAVERSRSQIMDAVDLRPEVVNLWQEDQVSVIPAEDAKIGDILLVRPGDRIPLDGVVTEGESRIDTSAVTGEPVPIKAAAGDSVTSGCVNTSGQLKIRVEHELKDSMVTRILDSVENAAASKPKIDRFITRFARIYTPFVVILALGTAVIPSLITGNWYHWIYTAITFLVISCPCALVLSVPLAFFSGIGAGSKRGILFKGGVALESLKDVKAVVMDKTGTITHGNFTLQKCVPSTDLTQEQLLSLAASCEQASTHPIATSIVTAAKEKKLAIERPTKVNELSGKGIQATLAQGEVLCGNKKLMESFQVDISRYDSAHYGSEVLLALNGTFVGYLVISDSIKEEAPSAIAQLKKQKIITAMLTGDAKESAENVAKTVGIDQVHAKLLPDDKLGKLQEIRSKYGTVMFVGDGINDAPVLAGADVGAAMGSGADAAIEAADVVFMTSSVEAIPQSIEIAKFTGKLALQNVVFALAIKALVMILGLAGFANMWMAVFADTGVAMLCILNSIRVLYHKTNK